MSIDDLYGERSWLRGKISACEYKISDLEKIIKRTKKEIEDLKEDKRRISVIINNIGNVTPYLGKANNNITNAKDSVDSYYFGNQTAEWKSRLKLTSNLTSGIKTSFDSIVRDGNSVIRDIDAEIKKKDNYLQETRDNLESTKDDLEGYESDLDDVQWEIDHYYDDEDD